MFSGSTGQTSTSARSAKAVTVPDIGGARPRDCQVCASIPLQVGSMTNRSNPTPPTRQPIAGGQDSKDNMRKSSVVAKQTGMVTRRFTRGRGFTLVELMITVAVVAILAAIAIPTYRQYIIRGNRSAAESVMMDLANREQQFLLANRSYADTTALTANGYTLPSDVGQNYNWAVTAGLDASSSAPIFTITFTPINGQSSDVTLTLDNQGTKSPIASWTH